VLAFTDDDCEPDRDWIARLRPLFQEGKFAAAGGPNLPPKPRTWQQAVVCAAPGAPSHVMLDDDEAEHLPGCNLVVTKNAFETIGGFDPQFHTAGDDVDFCWRLRDAGFRLGFVPGAFVWHWRRPSVSAFLLQQLGYGQAERLLLAKHPSRFSKRSGARWQGFIYGGGPVRVMTDSIIYYGPMGDAGYQAITNRMLPLRGLMKNFASWRAQLTLKAVKFLQPHVRAWARNHVIFFKPIWPRLSKPLGQAEEIAIHSTDGHDRNFLLKVLIRQGWKPAGETALWDLEKASSKVILATECGEGTTKRNLIRAWGMPPEKIAVLLEQNPFPREVAKLHKSDKVRNRLT
jgi:sulfur carrier protein ThiS